MTGARTPVEEEKIEPYRKYFFICEGMNPKENAAVYAFFKKTNLWLVFFL